MVLTLLPTTLSTKSGYATRALNWVVKIARVRCYRSIDDWLGRLKGCLAHPKLATYALLPLLPCGPSTIVEAAAESPEAAFLIASLCTTTVLSHLAALNRSLCRGQ